LQIVAHGELPSHYDGVLSNGVVCLSETFNYQWWYMVRMFNVIKANKKLFFGVAWLFAVLEY
tara:strand:- start:1161 stop:1346 length:186 start_codon:yes stop_codon:yes gene_type:complete